MTYTPGTLAVPSMVHNFMAWGPMAAAVATAAPGSASMSQAGATYQRLSVPTTVVARRLWWANGSAVSASYNIDCGIYADAGGKPGVRIVSTGNTAQGTASQVQFVDITDTVLPPGTYWLALVSSSSSATAYRVTLSVGLDASLSFGQASASPLPATATPVEASAADLWLCGFATTASP